jgi:hypothetical protein
MILDAFFTIVKGLLNGVLALIPIGGAPTLTYFLAALRTYVGSPFSSVAWAVPFDEGAAACAALLAWWVVCNVYRITLWFLGKLHLTGADE